MPKTDEGIELYSMHSYIFEKEKKSKEQRQQPPSLHGRSDIPNSWKEKKKIVSL